MLDGWLARHSRRARHCLTLALGLGLCLASWHGRAQAGPAPATLGSAAAAGSASAKPGAAPAPEEPAEAELSPGSPRAALQAYFELGRKGRYQEAAAFLEVPSEREGERAQLARRLRQVLDRRLWIDFDKVSELEGGNPNDGLPARFDQLGTIANEQGVAEPVRLVRRAGQAGSPAAQQGGVAPPNGVASPGQYRWMFSASTVARVDDWYEALPDRWLLEHSPAALLRAGPRNMLWGQWLGLLLGVLVCGSLGALTGNLLRRLMARAAKQTTTTWDDRLVARSRGPLALALSLVFLRAGLPLLQLYEPGEKFVSQGLRSLLLANLLWAVWRLMDVVGELAWDSPWSLAHPSSRALIPLARRVGKAIVGVVASLLVLQALEFPITSLLAGLGIGGLALALASQKTVENLFGAFSLGIDQPFREGDLVRVDDVLGNVETLGLRSTRIRTLERTLVTIPNGKLADMRIETLAARDRMRLFCNLGLAYGASAEQMRAVLTGLERTLTEHPRIWRQDISVRFTELTPYSLNIEVSCWFDTGNRAEFLELRQETLLAFMKVVEDAGASFAFPTQTIHLESTPQIPPSSAGGPQPLKPA